MKESIKFTNQSEACVYMSSLIGKEIAILYDRNPIYGVCTQIKCSNELVYYNNELISYVTLTIYTQDEHLAFSFKSWDEADISKNDSDLVIDETTIEVH